LGLCTAYTHTYTNANPSADAARTNAANTSSTYASTISYSLTTSFSQPDASH
jgi:hypothetical protein